MNRTLDDLENAPFEPGIKDRLINDALLKLATKHNTHAYNQCPQCQETTIQTQQLSSPPPTPISHPSACLSCKELLKHELSTLLRRQKTLQADLDLIDAVPIQPTGYEKEIVLELKLLSRRKKVLKAQIKEP
ncbi:MAG: hypothetical protein Q9201_001047, partial [Fulgogasparrea decipioides]